MWSVPRGVGTVCLTVAANPEAVRAGAVASVCPLTQGSWAQTSGLPACEPWPLLRFQCSELLSAAHGGRWWD